MVSRLSPPVMTELFITVEMRETSGARGEVVPWTLRGGSAQLTAHRRSLLFGLNKLHDTCSVPTTGSKHQASSAQLR